MSTKMRERKAIEKQIKKREKFGYNPSDLSDLRLEVLLDIRDLLVKTNKKLTKIISSAKD